MKFVFKLCLIAGCIFAPSISNAKTLEDFVRHAAIENGLIPLEELNSVFDSSLADIGKFIFESKTLSLNGDISCQTCHLDKFGSADGIPNAIGLGGHGDGSERALGGGNVIPRNTLPLWGRGSSLFDVFFWDGRVDFSTDQKLSQFGTAIPSEDPLIVALHLPVLEIREMLVEDKFVSGNKNETADSAETIIHALLDKLWENHSDELRSIAKIKGVANEDLQFVDIVETMKEFFKRKFAVPEYPFYRFVYKDARLNAQELKGAALFYGKGKCAVCHSGPFFSDLKYHSVPFNQLGSGKNGFGVDYGRFNVTHDPSDLYKFRTPPLLNAPKTAPYGHSGSVASLRDAVVRHFDPLRSIVVSEMGIAERVEFYKRIAASSETLLLTPSLDDDEVSNIIDFLELLEF